MKKKNFILFFILLFSTALQVFSQAGEPIEYKEEKVTRTFYRRGIAETKTYYYHYFRTQGMEEWMKVGGLGKNIKPYISTCPQALKLLKKYKWKRLGGPIVGVGGGGLFFGSAIAAMTGGGALPIVGVVAGIGVGFYGMYLRVSSRDELKEIVELYNQSVSTAQVID